jgi:hypothetical protein
LLKEGVYAQNPRLGVSERYRDFSPTMLALVCINAHNRLK